MSEQVDNEMDAMAIGLAWMKDSSLEKWFPISAEQIAQLTKERDELKSHSLTLRDYNTAITKERDQLAAKCAEMRDVVRLCEWAGHASERILQNNYVCPVCHVYGPDCDNIPHQASCKLAHALSDQCGQGWRSPEDFTKAVNDIMEQERREQARLIGERDALSQQKKVEALEWVNQYTVDPLARNAAKQALEACK